MTTDGHKSPFLHLVLRIPLTAKPLPEVLAAHTEVARKFGSVWVGVKTRSLAPERIKRLTDQRAREMLTYLFVVQKTGNQFDGFRGEIVGFAERLSKQEHEQVPSYYGEEGITYEVKFWVKIRNIAPVPHGQLARLRVNSTQSLVVEAMNHSMLTLALVYIQA